MAHLTEAQEKLQEVTTALDEERRKWQEVYDAYRAICEAIISYCDPSDTFDGSNMPAMLDLAMRRHQSREFQEGYRLAVRNCAGAVQETFRTLQETSDKLRVRF